MNWSRAKTILIILFLCTNTFLLATIILSSENSSVVTEDVVKSTVFILKENEVEISADIIPLKTKILPVIDLPSPCETDGFMTEKEAKKIMRRLDGEEREETVKNVANVLMDFVSHPEHENTHIIALEHGYSSDAYANGTVLVPSWKIVCENGKEFVLAAN